MPAKLGQHCYESTNQKLLTLQYDFPVSQRVWDQVPDKHGIGRKSTGSNYG